MTVADDLHPIWRNRQASQTRLQYCVIAAILSPPVSAVYADAADARLFEGLSLATAGKSLPRFLHETGSGFAGITNSRSVNYECVYEDRDQETSQEASAPEEKAALPVLPQRLRQVTTTDLC